MLAAPALAEDGVTATEIVIGTHTALSGPVSAWGIGSTEGMRMRFEEANEKGIHGRKIKFVVEDHQYQVPRAVQAANKLINNDKIFAMVGALGTPQNNAVLGEQLQKGVPNLFPFTAARSMAEPFHKLKFAAFSTYYDQVRAVVKHFVEKEGKKKICTMYQDTDFGHEIRDGVREQAKAMKLEVVERGRLRPDGHRVRRAGHQAQVGGLRHRDHGLDHQGQHPGRRHRQEARLGRRDVRRPGGVLRSDRGGGARRHHGGLLLRHRHALRLCRHLGGADQGLGREVQVADQPGPQQRRAVRLRDADIVVKALEAAGQDLTRAKLVAALEGTKNYKPMFPGPAINYGPNGARARRRASSPRSKAAAGRWWARTCSTDRARRIMLDLA